MKRILSILLSFIVLGMTACFEDDSTLGKDFIPDIEINGLRDTLIISYSHNVLEVNPQIVTNYDDSDLSYAWYIYNSESNRTTNGDKLEGFRTEKIGEEKNLSYEVNLPSGIYTIVFEVTAELYNYSRVKEMKLSTATEFSKGFYILKETEDGRSEIDLATEIELNTNLMTAKFGAPLEGKPINLSVAYNQCYIDDETAETGYTKVLNVFTEKDYRGIRTEDLVQVHDRSTIFYSGMTPEDEVLYSIGQSDLALYLFTNKGFYRAQGGYELIPGSGIHIRGSGKYDFRIGTSASKFAQVLKSGDDGMVYWNETERLLYWGNFVEFYSLSYDLPTNMDAATLECLASGTNFVGSKETVWFLLCDVNGNRCLLIPRTSKSECDVISIDPASRFAKAEVITGNTRSATIIYFVSDNRLWAYNLNGGGEYEIPLPGVEGEITYISNPFVNIRGSRNQVDINNLVVVTQAGQEYNLYIFGKDNLVGGVPQVAVKPFRGSGKVKCVRYLYDGKISHSDMSATISSNLGAVIPWTD